MVVLVLLAGEWLPAKTHVMGRGADPWVVPEWEAVFDEGPFDLPAGTTRDTPVAEALRLGWKALHELDDREAERAFRLVVTRDEENAEGYFGLALANDAWPGRALAFANRARAKSGGASEPIRSLADRFATVCAARGPARRIEMGEWARAVRAAWRSAPEGEPRLAMTALLVRATTTAGLLGEARMRHRELMESAPDHPARTYALWLAATPEQAVAALKAVPESPGARRAAGALLERLGRPIEAARWYAAAAALAGARHPSDMEDWRMVEDMRTAEVTAMAAAGRSDFPDEVPVSVRAEAWLRLEAWDRLAKQPDLPVKAPLKERLALAHARALAAFAQNRLPDAHAWLAEVQSLMARARTGQAGITPQELPEFEALESELQLYNLQSRGAAEEARLRFAQLKHIPPLRLARLALALDLPLEANRNARLAMTSKPHAQPELDAMIHIAQVTQQRLPPEMDQDKKPSWPEIPPAPPVPPASAPGQMPSWSLPSADGAEHSLASVLGGQTTVFLFFLGHECRHCMDQLRTFDPYAARFSKAGARLVAVSADGPEGVAKTFASLESETVRRPFAFPVLADADRRAFAPWGVMDEFLGDAIHGVFVVDAGGRLRWRHLGVEPYMMVSDVLAAVEEIGAQP